MATTEKSVRTPRAPARIHGDDPSLLRRYSTGERALYEQRIVLGGV